MRELFDKTLCEKYPKIFANRHASPSQTAMCWGFECGDGWYNIIDTLCSNIQKHIDTRAEERELAIKFNIMKNDAIADNWRAFDEWFKNVPADRRESYKQRVLAQDYQVIKDPIPQVIAEQVKTKFGGLCFYYSGGDEHIRTLVNAAEELSATTCEKCGAPGTIRSNGWISTLCDKHAEDQH